MIYDFLGKKMTKAEVQKELLYNPAIKNAHLESIHVYLNAQRKINAKERIKKETDPYKKKLMKEMYSHRRYDFDCYFGEE